MTVYHGPVVPEHSGGSGVWGVGGPASGVPPVCLWSISLLPPLPGLWSQAGHQVPGAPSHSTPRQGW